jgi:uncharacterized protein YukE
MQWSDRIGRRLKPRDLHSCTSKRYQGCVEDDDENSEEIAAQLQALDAEMDALIARFAGDLRALRSFASR